MDTFRHGQAYSGVFNGQGHRITGLNFSAASFGLFLFFKCKWSDKEPTTHRCESDGSSGGALEWWTEIMAKSLPAL